jgi:outer membrane protein assembly factor BamB
MTQRTYAKILTVFAASCALVGCSKSWPMFRHNTARSGHQGDRSRLSKPSEVANLKVVWTFSPSGAQGFYSSPIVHDGRVYIGNGNGVFYALNEKTGAVVWQYPSGTPLTSTFVCNPSSFGIASSAVATRVGGKEAVIFGAPDQASGAHLGDGHLIALNAETGALIWESPAVAQVTGSGPNDLHEQIGYSSPLVFHDRVYIGIADHCDNPIQNGKVMAVHLSDGTIDSAFNYVSTSTRGGGIWNSPAGHDDDLFVTTGNTANGNVSQPAVNHGLSMLRLNKDNGSVVWQHQPVPYVLDDDPDWAAGAVVMETSCGRVVTSQQKDGWAWSVDSHTGGVRWAFPTGPWATSGFQPADGTVHGDTDYKRPGAAWGNVYVGVVGGLDTTTNLSGGYTQLHALNVCAPENRRVRWIKDVPATGGGGYPLGPPTISHGIVYVGTNEGHLVVIADPKVAPPSGWRCSDPNVPLPTCAILGALGSVVRLVPDPVILKDIALPGASGIFGEPALVGDRVFIADTGGKVFMLDADP